MRKTVVFALLVGTLVLAACTPATPVPTATPTPLPSPTPTTAPTAVSGEPIQQVEDCQVVTMLPDPQPVDAALFAGISDADHALGPADAKVTILEYSDFQ